MPSPLLIQHMIAKVDLCLYLHYIDPTEQPLMKFALVIQAHLIIMAGLEGISDPVCMLDQFDQDDEVLLVHLQSFLINLLVLRSPFSIFYFYFLLYSSLFIY